MQVCRDQERDGIKRRGGGTQKERDDFLGAGEEKSVNMNVE